MIGKETILLIEQEAKTLFEKLEYGGAIAVRASEEDGVNVDVDMTDPQMLIGERGQTLFEIQHVLKRMLKKKLAEPVEISLDINDYKKSRESYIRDMANSIANEVSLHKREKELPVMSPAERRVVHVEIAKREDVESVSTGEGEERRVVIRVKKIL